MSKKEQQNVLSKNKVFIILFISIIILITLSISFIMVGAKSYKLVNEYFDTKFVELENQQTLPDSLNIDDKRFGLSIEPKRNNAEIIYKDDISGKTELEYRFYSDNQQNIGIRNCSFLFEDINSDETFRINVANYGSQREYIVLVNNKRFSVCGKNTGLIIKGKDSDKLIFDVNTLTVYINDNLLWNFSKFINGDYNNDFIFNNFAQYKISIEFNNIGEDGKVLLYSINGQQFDKNIVYINEQSPQIYAPIINNGVVGETYQFPKPYAYDVIDGTIDSTKIKYVVKKKAQIIISERNYEEGANFIPNETGEYTITYKVSDKKELESILSQRFKVLDSVPQHSFYEYSVINNMKIGKGTKLLIPRIKAKDDLTILRDTYTSVTIRKDGQIVEGYNKKGANGFYYTFEDEGNYKITYQTTKVIKEFNVYVGSGKPSLILDKEIPLYITVGTRHALPEGIMKLGDKELKTIKTIKYPSGKKYTGTHFTFDEYGNYEIEYISQDGEIQYSEKRYVKVITPTQTMFSGDVDIQNTEYHRHGDVYKGISVTETLGKGGVTFNEPIDLTNYKKGDLFIDMTAYPFNPGEKDFGQIFIQLTDIVDKNNYISIRISRQGWRKDDNDPSVCYTQVSHSGLTYKGAEFPDRIYSGESQYGYYSSHPFAGNESLGFGSTIKLSMDYAKKRIYWGKNPDINRGLEGDGAIVDLSSLALYDKEWKGFTDGKCYVSIYASRIKGSQARYMIRQIGNYDLQNEVVNYTKPSIEIDYKGNETVPTGIIGESYTVFNAVSKDIYSDNIDIQTRVYYNYGKNKQMEIDIVDGQFIPIFGGEYTIVYTSKDGLENETKEEIKVNVTERKDNFRISVSELEQNIKSGNHVLIQKPEYTGNHGNVIFKSQSVTLDGKEISIKDGVFFVDKKGDYKVNIEMIDYLGQTASIQYIVKVIGNDAPVFDNELQVLPVYAVGSEYSLPNIKAYEYNDIDIKELEVQIEVEYSDGFIQTITDRKFIPISKHGNKAFIKYVSGISKIEKEISIVSYDSSKGKLNIPDFFVKENVNIVTDKESTNMQHRAEVVDKSKHANFIFGKPLSVEMLSLRMLINPTENAFNELRITLIDSEDLSSVIELQVKKKDKKSTLVVNRKDTCQIQGSFWGNDNEKGSIQDLQIKYKNNSRQIMDASQNAVMGVTKTLSEKEFLGFKSGKVFVKFEFIDIDTTSKLKAAVNIREFNNQFMGDMKVDTAKPELKIQGEYGGILNYGTEVELPLATATDVLSEIKSITIEVKDPENQIVEALDGTVLNKADATRTYRIKYDKYGQYKITYYATDTNNNTATALTKTVYILRDSKPKFTLENQVVSESKQNNDYVAPNIIVDDENCSYNIIMINPNFEHTIIYSSVNAKKAQSQNKEYSMIPYKFVYKGEYTLRYYVYDQYYGYSYQDYTIIVK